MNTKDYLNNGIYQTKLIEAQHPSVIWNVRMKKLMNHGEFDIIPTDDGNFKITIENNRMVNVMSYTELSKDIVDKINNSEHGIIFYNEGQNYRFQFIPIK